MGGKLLIGWEKECAEFLNWGVGRFGNWLIVVARLKEVDGFAGHTVDQTVLLGDASGATVCEEVLERFGLSWAVKGVALASFFRARHGARP